MLLTDRGKVTLTQMKDWTAHCSITLWSFLIHPSGCMVMTLYHDINICPIRLPHLCTPCPSCSFNSSSFSFEAMFSLSVPHLAYLSRPHWSLCLKCFSPSRCSYLSCHDTCASPHSPSESHTPVACLSVLRASQSVSMTIYVIMCAQTSPSRLQDAVKEEGGRTSNPPGCIKIKSNQIIQTWHLHHMCDYKPLKIDSYWFLVMFQDVL